MLISKIRILNGLAFCLILSACTGCDCCYNPDRECIETQDVAYVRGIFYYNFSFDKVVTQKDNEIMRCNLIGSQTNKVKFPIHINTRLFLRGTLLQSLDFDMPENSVLTFYDRNFCEMIDSTVTPSDFVIYPKWQFYGDVQQAINDGSFIDSSRSEIACWMMRKITEDDYMRCTKEIISGSGTHNVEYCI